jgi:hypothetical protein
MHGAGGLGAIHTGVPVRCDTLPRGFAGVLFAQLAA